MTQSTDTIGSKPNGVFTDVMFLFNIIALFLIVIINFEFIFLIVILFLIVRQLFKSISKKNLNFYLN
jgi:hypothetical protein